MFNYLITLLLISLTFLIFFILKKLTSLVKTIEDIKDTFDNIFYPVFTRDAIRIATEKTKVLLVLMNNAQTEYESKLDIHTKSGLHPSAPDEALRMLACKFIEAELEYEHQLESLDFMRHSNLAVFNGKKKPEEVRKDQRNYKSMIADMDKKFEIEERLKNWEIGLYN